MDIKLNFIDSAYADDPKGYDAFFNALQEMLNRMAVSHFKYQHRAVPPTMEAATQPIDMMRCIYQRVAMYDSTGASPEAKRSLKEIGKPVNTGNTEWLLDAANQCVIERLFPKHPKAHFKATESKDSPGLAYKE